MEREGKQEGRAVDMGNVLTPSAEPVKTSYSDRKPKKKKSRAAA